MSAEVVIIGGGVIGASIAHHLALRGVREIVVLERDTLGAGSTSRNAGGIRLQFSSEINVRLSQRSIPRFLAFEAELGIDPAFHQVGYLFLITTDRDEVAFTRSLALWERLGIPARRLETAEAQRLFPECAMGDVRFATFCAEDGYADPSSILNGYVAAARRAGVVFREGAAVTAIECSAGRVQAVRIGEERIACGRVIDAAGAWAGEVGRLAGVELPVRPLRRHIFVTDAVPSIARDVPMTIDFASGLYLHRESGGVLLGMADPAEGVAFDQSVNWDFLPVVVERALARVPALERATIRTGWAGLYEDTPDRHPIIGAAGPEGFLVCAGFSGHGLMHAPAAGELVAELIVDGRTSFDLTPLRADRFASGDLVQEHNVV